MAYAIGFLVAYFGIGLILSRIILLSWEVRSFKFAVLLTAVSMTFWAFLLFDGDYRKDLKDGFNLLRGKF
jgi:hypothetical protein